MECRHCHEKFERDAEFADHCDNHAKIQVQLGRTGKRTYGARYTESESAKDKEPKPEPKRPEHPRAQQTALPVRSKPASTFASTTPAASSPKSPNKTVLERVQSIIDRFEPYEDGVESKTQRPAELPCPDCDFKLRDKKELDHHFLSVYCRGSHIVQYALQIDKTKPRGYFVEELLVPYDEHAHPSEFQCRKCGNTFPSLRAMQEHEATHPILPQICLHCAKVFGTAYELEDHYDWHDDMEYRQRVDKLPAEPAVADDLDEEEGDIVPADVTDFGRGIQKIPFTHLVGKKAPGLPKDGTLAGISSISKEDVEMRFAPHGRLVKPLTHYYTMPAYMTDDEMDRILAQHDANPNRFSVRDGGQMNEIGRKTPSRRETRSSRSGPPGGLRILAHGRPGAVQVRDVSGRIRWLDGGAFGNVVTWVIGLPGFEEELAKAVDEAVGWEESGNLNRALPSWKKVLELLMGPGSSHMDRQKRFMALTKLAVLSSQLNRTDEAISYWCDALELSEKLYGIHSINNFNIINSIAVIFDERGDYGQAAPLYRRSLAGRLRIRGPDHADTLMSMQELGMANWRLNRATAARKLLEKACLGYENLRPRDDGKMVFMVLLNLASVYGSLGMKTSAEALLLNGIPRMRAALGLQDKVLAYALGSYLQQRQGTALPPTILDTIQAVRQKSDSEHWVVVTEALAAFHCQNRRYRDGLRLYQEVIQRHHQQHQVPNDPRLVKTIHAVAHCHELLGELVEAEAACRKWASLVAPGTPTHAFATQSLDKIRRRLDNISTERQKWDLPPYTSPSTLPAPRPCAVCKSHTNQLCPDCQIFPLCPISDSPSCTEKHKSCSQCVPSLLPSESQTTLLDPAFPAPDLAARFQTLFAGDEHLRHTFLSGNPSTSTQPPRLITTQALFVAIRPRCIATVRLPKRRDRLVSFWFNTRCDADVRIRWRSGGPWGVDAAMVGGGGGWKDLRGAAGMGMMYLYPSDDDYWLSVAPGEETLGKARQERAHVFPDEDGGKGGLTAEGVPDREMLEWLQLVDGDDDGEWNRNSGGGLGLKLELVLVMMEWEC